MAFNNRYMQGPTPTRLWYEIDNVTSVTQLERWIEIRSVHIPRYVKVSETASFVPLNEQNVNSVVHQTLQGFETCSDLSFAFQGDSKNKLLQKLAQSSTLIHLSIPVGIFRMKKLFKTFFCTALSESLVHLSLGGYAVRTKKMTLLFKALNYVKSLRSFRVPYLSSCNDVFLLLQLDLRQLEQLELRTCEYLEDFYVMSQVLKKRGEVGEDGEAVLSNNLPRSTLFTVQMNNGAYLSKLLGIRHLIAVAERVKYPIEVHMNRLSFLERTNHVFGPYIHAIPKAIVFL